MNNQQFMNSPHTRACWLLRFCQNDLTQLTGQALGQLQNEWVEFLGDIWKGNHPPVRSRLVEWQQEVSGNLEKLKHGQPWVMNCGVWRQLKLVNDQLQVQQKTYPLPAEADNELLVRVMDTLEAVSKDLRLCAREKCRKVFVRSKRQDYCSARCRGTEGTRRYRQKLAKPLSTGPA